MHIFVQLMEWRVGDNPRGQWTYGDEDLVGTMVEVSKSCPPSTLAPVSFAKWLLLAGGLATSRRTHTHTPDCIAGFPEKRTGAPDI